MPAPDLIDHKARLNRESPALAAAKFGDVTYDLIAQVNAQQAVIEALVAKLNADVGVSDADYSAAGLVAVKKPEER